MPITTDSVSKIGKLLALLLILAAVFVGVQVYLNQVDVSAMPAEVQQFFVPLVAFFKLAPALLIIGFLRNIFGFFIEWTKGKYGESYEFSKFLTTIGYYVGLIGIIAVAVPAPYNEIGSFVLVIVNLVLQAISGLKKPTVTVSTVPS